MKNSGRYHLYFVVTFFLFTACKREHFPGNLTPETPVLAEFQNTYGGSGDERIFSIKETSDHNYIFAGYTTTMGNGDKDVFLGKIDQNGNLLWSKAIGGAGIDEGFDLIETPDHAYLVAGFSKSFTFTNGYDVYLIKTNVNGDVLWQKTFGDYNNDCAISIALSKDNSGYILTGGTDGHLVLLGTEIYVAKVDFNGDSLWTRTYSGSTYEIGKSVCQDNAGNIILLCSAGNSYPGNDLLVLKLNANGDSIWSKSYGGADFEDAGTITGTGNDFIFCSTTASFGDPNGDVWLTKINASGDLLWDKTWGDPYADAANCIITTSDNHYLIAGSQTDSLDAVRALLLKTDLYGNQVWKKTFGESAQYVASKVIETSDAYVMAGSKKLPSGAYDGFVIKVKKQ